MKNFISLSGGVESTTMAILYGKGAKAIWCDTGSEHNELYDRIDTLESKLKDIHNGDFELIRIKPSVTAKGKKVSRLSDYIYRMSFMPSKQKRFCTGLFKIEPIDKFLKEQGECNLMIGLNVDEEPGKDRTGNYMKCKNVNYTYPLYNDGYSRDMCEDILIKYGLHPKFPIYMQRGGCKFCIFKTVSEYKALYFFDRETFEDNRTLEKSIQDKRKKFFTMSVNRISFDDIAKICEEEIYIWGIDRVRNMYKKIKPSKSCGAFCHR